MSLKKLNHKKQQQFSALVKKAEQLVQTRQFEQALNVYKTIYDLSHDPRSLQIQAVCLYRLKRFDEAIQMSEKSLEKFTQLGKQDIATLENLTEIYGVTGNKEKYQHFGALCLKAKDILAVKNALPIASSSSTPPQGSKKVFSFSLYGAEPKYCESALLNVAAAKALFPSFVCRFYLDDSVPAHVQNRLIEAQAEVIKVTPPFTSLPKTMWRFLVLDDPQVSISLCRDADSVISLREKDVIEEWLISGFSAHIIRDFPSHCELILAGLFGLKNGFVNQVGNAMLDYVSKNVTVHHTDQNFLRHFLWPQIKTHTLTHDRCFNFGKNQGKIILPPPTNSTDHIGSNLSAASIQIKTDVPDNTKIQYHFILDTDDKIGPYTVFAKNKLSSFFIPQYFANKLSSSQLKIDWQSII